MESEFTRKVCSQMKRCNAIVFAIVGGPMQEVGWPDRFVAHTRWNGFLEFKGPNTKLGLKQRIIIERLWERGVQVYVIREPNRIEWVDGRLLDKFEDGKDLICRLQKLSQQQ